MYCPCSSSYGYAPGSSRGGAYGSVSGSNPPTASSGVLTMISSIYGANRLPAGIGVSYVRSSTSCRSNVGLAVGSGVVSGVNIR